MPPTDRGRRGSGSAPRVNTRSRPVSTPTRPGRRHASHRPGPFTRPETRRRGHDSCWRARVSSCQSRVSDPGRPRGQPGAARGPTGGRAPTRPPDNACAMTDVRAARTRATIQDVADEAACPAAPSPRVLNDEPYVSAEAREAVQAAVRRVGYVRSAASRSLVTRRSGAVALIVHEPSVQVLDDPNIGNILIGTNTVLSEADQQLVTIMVDSGRDNERVVEYLRGGFVDGAIVLSARDDGDPVTRAIEEIGLPACFVGHPTDAPNTSYIAIDNPRRRRADHPTPGRDRSAAHSACSRPGSTVTPVRTASRLHRRARRAVSTRRSWPGTPCSATPRASRACGSCSTAHPTSTGSSRRRTRWPRGRWTSCSAPADRCRATWAVGFGRQCVGAPLRPPAVDRPAARTHPRRARGAAGPRADRRHRRGSARPGPADRGRLARERVAHPRQRTSPPAAHARPGNARPHPHHRQVRATTQPSPSARCRPRPRPRRQH